MVMNWIMTCFLSAVVSDIVFDADLMRATAADREDEEPIKCR